MPDARPVTDCPERRLSCCLWCLLPLSSQRVTHWKAFNEIHHRSRWVPEADTRGNDEIYVKLCPSSNLLLAFFSPAMAAAIYSIFFTAWFCSCDVGVWMWGQSEWKNWVENQERLAMILDSGRKENQMTRRATNLAETVARPSWLTLLETDSAAICTRKARLSWNVMPA